SCCCAIPSTRRYGSATSATRWRAKIGGVTITFAIPVSSSRDRKTKPFAVPGRWRTMTLPATWTRAPSATPASSRALRTPRRQGADGRERFQLVALEVGPVGEVVDGAERLLVPRRDDRARRTLAQPLDVPQSQPHREAAVGAFDRAQPLRARDIDREDAQAV